MRKIYFLFIYLFYYRLISLCGYEQIIANPPAPNAAKRRMLLSTTKATQILAGIAQHAWWIFWSSTHCCAR